MQLLTFSDLSFFVERNVFCEGTLVLGVAFAVRTKETDIIIRSGVFNT